ncbi:MAG: hypothetical protein ACYTGH_00655, partial [Planctomycetota bacterium]
MADKPTDFSLHEMEGLKRRMQEMGPFSEVPEEASLQAPMRPTAPPPPVSDMPEQGEAPPQGIFS